MHSRTLGLMAVLVAGGLALAQSPPGGVTYPTVPTLGTAPAGPAPVVGGGTALAADSGPIVYAAADYILWQIRKGNIPVTAQTVPVGLIAVDISDLFTRDPSVPGQATGTQVTGFAPISVINNDTFGGGPFTNIGGQNGGRFTVGYFADSDMSWGLEAQFAFIERGSDSFNINSSQQGNQFILDTGFTRQLFLVNGSGPNLTQTSIGTFGVFVARETTASLSGYAASSLYTGEVNGRTIGFRVGGFDFGGLVGFRYTHFADELQLRNNVRLFAPPGIPQTSADLTGSLSRDLNYQTSDRTRTYNHFFGGQAGVDIDATFGSVFINARLKAAVGLMHQIADIQSRTQLINNDPGRSPPGYVSDGGLLAAPGQNGRRTRDRFGFIPEANVKLGYQFADWFRGYVGYDGMVLVNAVRPGSSVVLNSLSTQVNAGTSPPFNVNINQPTFKFRDQDVWVQGLSFGFEASY